jgi:endonuclease/exonuclease/phosphatase (EEP) superfamily protein YafD
LESARKWLEAQTHPALLVGDLNLTMFSPEYRRFTKDLHLKNARKGFGPLGTWPAWVPFARLPLDHCLVQGDLAVVNCMVGPDIGSDHLPIIVDLHVSPE